jgi:MSHA biogenesis protein MshN
MDLFDMSLINQMLQDLEGRRSEGQVAGTMHGQVRAAPEPRRIHFAWWLVLGLTLILTGVISWLWGYRTAPVAVSTAPVPRLALKLESSIETPQALMPNSQPVEAESDSTPVVAVTPLSSAKEDDSDPVSNEAVENRAQGNAASTSTAPLSRHVSAASASPVALPIPAAAQANTPLVSVPAPVRLPTPAADSSARGPAANKAATNAPIGTSKPNPADPVSKQTGKETAFDIPTHVAKQIKELTPAQRADEEYRRATILIHQGRSSESIAALEKALQIDPQHSVARQTLAGLLLDAKRPDDAMRKLQDGLNVDRNDPALAMMLARLQVDKGELRPAVETLQRTLSYAAERADYQAFLAALLQREGRHKEAAEHFMVALRKSPQNGLWWMGIGISLQADNRSSEARDAFGRAKESNNLSPELLAFVNQKLNQLR